jgi:hypothetical protein
MLRRAGTHSRGEFVTWAPAQQRTAKALRCVRGTRSLNRLARIGHRRRQLAGWMERQSYPTISSRDVDGFREGLSPPYAFDLPDVEAARVGFGTVALESPLYRHAFGRIGVEFGRRANAIDVSAKTRSARGCGLERQSANEFNAEPDTNRSARYPNARARRGRDARGY